MSRRSYAQDQRRRRRACRLDVERCEERTLLSSGLGELTASGPPDTIPLKAAADYTLTTLASFNGANGAVPVAGLVRDPQGNLFGTTPAAGPAARHGLRAGRRQRHHHHPGLVQRHQRGRSGGGLVRDAQGNLFGTTQFGGANGDGTVFELAAGTGTITTLAIVQRRQRGQSAGRPGARRAGQPLRHDAFGGANDQGTVFELAAGSSTITTLASFNGTNGDQPTAGLVRDPRGNLFGTTHSAGPTARARSSSWPPAAAPSPPWPPSTAPTGPVPGGRPGARPAGQPLRHDRRRRGQRPGHGLRARRRQRHHHHPGLLQRRQRGHSVGRPGARPAGQPLRHDGDGGANDVGTVFELAAGSGAITTLASFNGANGANPAAGLVRDPRGNLFGTTIRRAGPTILGTVFELSP